jgi:hypothetical protein
VHGVKTYRKRLIFLSCAVAACAIPAILFFAAIDRVFDWAGSRDEVPHVTSPPGRHDAVMFESNGGATISFGYEIHVVRSGTKQIIGVRDGEVANLYGATRNASASGANLRWQDDRTLVVEYLTAQHIHVNHPMVVIDGAAVIVELRSGIADATAPPGGMLHNRRGRPPS